MVAAGKTTNETVNKTILIVEDEPDTVEMFAEMMRLSGYRVLKSYGSKSAISMLAQEKPDGVILDLMLPDVSGLEVLRFIRSQPTLMHIPVIVISAKSLPVDIKTGMEMGASIYLTKPVTFLEFKKAIETAIPKND
jgi:DNA-binding response OmpR family regulator